MKKHASSGTKAPPAKAAPEQPPRIRNLSVTSAPELESLPRTAVAAAAIPKIAPMAGGSTVTDRRAVRFGYFQPDAGEVFLVGSFNGWNPKATPLKRDALGDWSVELMLPPGEYRYRLMVDGEWRDDPSAQQTAMNPFGGFDGIITV